MNKDTRQQIETRIDADRARALHATLGRPGSPPGEGDALPTFWHWTQFWITEPPDRLGRDGHPAHGDHLPDTGLPRRMWAGGALDFHAPLIIGMQAKRVSTAGPVVKKQGRSGPLAFLTITHEVFQDGRLCIHETQDLVFREDPAPGAPAPSTKPAPTDADWRKDLQAGTTELFRYSALTFNGHRIHYDLPYAREVEGYAGLVVHGPLMAQRLVELAEDNLGPLSRFTFRALAPVMHTDPFSACGNAAGTGQSDLWIRREDGALAMTASAISRTSTR